MDTCFDPFTRANLSLREKDVRRFHRQQRRQQILRSQVGFLDTSSFRPEVCQGCEYYHGILYGSSYETRTLLVCAFHPYGWQGEADCPDWRGNPKPMAEESL